MPRKNEVYDKQHSFLIVIFAVLIFFLGILSVLSIEIVSKKVRVATNLSSYKIHGHVPNVQGNAVLAGFYEVLLYTKQSEGTFSSYVKDNAIKPAIGMPSNFTFEDWSYNQTFIIAIANKAVIADNRYINVLIINKE